MRIDEATFDLIDKAENITKTDYEVKWFDKDTFDGYIDDDNLVAIIQDLLVEIDYLNEEIDDLKRPKEKDYDAAWERQVIGI